jgi:cytochrome P450
MTAENGGAVAGLDRVVPGHDLYEHVAGALGDPRDPHPGLAYARRATPVLRNDTDPFDPTGPPSYNVYRYGDVLRVLRDNAGFSSTIVTEFLGRAMGSDIIVGMDEPKHRRYRTLVSAGFTHRALPRWAEQIRPAVEELVDRLAGRGRAELVHEFTLQFPAAVIATVLGLPRQDHIRFGQWAAATFAGGADRRAALTALLQLRDYLAGVLAERRRSPAEDLVSDLACAEVDGHRLSDREIFSFLRLLLSAGVETTYRSSGNLLFALLTHPDQLDAVRSDRSLVPGAVEEGLRWEPPALFVRRRCVRHTEIGGVGIPAGSAVTLMLAAANRDERRWDRPECFDLRRRPLPHLAFGAGPHFCLGMHLARLETQLALEALLDRFAGLRLDPAGDDPHIRGQVFRSPTALPVRLR